jgi:hypothetical protein
MELAQVVALIADALKEFDSSRPVCKTPKRTFQPGIGPFGEPLLIKTLQGLLIQKGYPSTTHRTPDLMIGSEWALEFKIVRPFGDNGNEAENWSVNLLHPYRGNVSSIGDAYKLLDYQTAARKAVLVLAYEHETVAETRRTIAQVLRSDSWLSVQFAVGQKSRGKQKRSGASRASSS